MKIITVPAETEPAFPVSEFAPENEILFFDIETTGLRRETTQVYLIGCAYMREEQWWIRQYLAESALDEQEIMEAFCEFAKDFKTLIHFNGDGFDIPYLAYKAEYYNFDLDFEQFQSIDMYKLAKPLKKILGLESLKQKSIECFLGICREDTYGGGALIPVYYEFERSADPEAERLLLLHNFDDVKGMLSLTEILNYVQLADGEFTFERLETAKGFAIFEYRLKNALSSGFERESRNGEAVISAENSLLQISVRIFEGVAKLPLEDVENYYYLPEEDRVIHKDVGQFVDRAHRKKATKKNCFLKKEGQFLPQKKILFTPAFQIEGEKRKTFFELTEAVSDNHRSLIEYALDIMNF
ncbi:MAG: ribonuclease H-like domain-containing protein [Parasporobacterium sp.]|nr:ribonuclease H-like domain-containing protein [Parasporobacterium sp.]